MALSGSLKLVAAGLGITAAPLSLAFEGLVPIDVEGYDLTRRVGLLTGEAMAGEDKLRRHFEAWIDEMG
jgi:DNA-binding transcriptional LysR family regulator